MHSTAGELGEKVPLSESPKDTQASIPFAFLVSYYLQSIPLLLPPRGDSDPTQELCGLATRWIDSMTRSEVYLQGTTGFVWSGVEH
jgi:hypothetical protein